MSMKTTMKLRDVLDSNPDQVLKLNQELRENGLLVKVIEAKEGQLKIADETAECFLEFNHSVSHLQQRMKVGGKYHLTNPVIQNGSMILMKKGSYPFETLKKFPELDKIACYEGKLNLDHLEKNYKNGEFVQQALPLKLCRIKSREWTKNGKCYTNVVFGDKDGFLEMTFWGGIPQRLEKTLRKGLVYYLTNFTYKVYYGKEGKKFMRGNFIKGTTEFVEITDETLVKQFEKLPTSAETITGEICGFNNYYEYKVCPTCDKTIPKYYNNLEECSTLLCPNCLHRFEIDEVTTKYSTNMVFKDEKTGDVFEMKAWGKTLTRWMNAEMLQSAQFPTTTDFLSYVEDRQPRVTITMKLNRNNDTKYDDSGEMYVLLSIQLADDEEEDNSKKCKKTKKSSRALKTAAKAAATKAAAAAAAATKAAATANDMDEGDMEEGGDEEVDEGDTPSDTTDDGDMELASDEDTD